MRNTSRVLGIIGGVISILLGLFLMLGGALFLNDSLWENAYVSPGFDREALMEGNNMAGMAFIGFGIAAIAAGALGLVSGIIVKRKNVAAGAMMIVAAVISFFTFFNLVSMTLFIIGAVMALKREPQAVVVPYPAYPPQYYPYPPQQYPPQYPPQQYPSYPQYPYSPQQQPVSPAQSPPEPPK